MSRPLLDTHAWVWWICGDLRLTARERDALDSLPPPERPVLAEISLWEVATLVERGRLELDMDLERWLAVASALALQVMTATLIGAMLPLGAVAFKLDPAIVASPALTTMVDISGLLIFFAVISRFITPL